MSPVPVKVVDRLSAGIKTFLPVIASAKSRDVNESDTVIIITDMLGDLFGFNKYSEITSEYVIRGTYADLAVKLDGKIQMLIEVKAIGSDLKEPSVKQAVDYAANQGIEWVILTNAAIWKIYKVTFGKPIGQELILEIDFLAINHKNSDDLESLYMLTKEGVSKAMLNDYHTQRQALSRYSIAAILLSQPALEVIKRELRKISPDVKIDTEQISDVLQQEILKRDVMEGEKADEARRKIARAASRAMRKATKESPADEDSTSDEAQPESN